MRADGLSSLPVVCDDQLLGLVRRVDLEALVASAALASEPASDQVVA